MNRREFLAASGAVLLTSACQRSAAHALPEGDLLGADFSIGHQLRDGGLPEASCVLRLISISSGVQ